MFPFAFLFCPLWLLPSVLSCQESAPLCAEMPNSSQKLTRKDTFSHFLSKCLDTLLSVQKTLLLWKGPHWTPPRFHLPLELTLQQQCKINKLKRHPSPLPRAFAAVFLFSVAILTVNFMQDTCKVQTSAKCRHLALYSQNFYSSFVTFHFCLDVDFFRGLVSLAVGRDPTMHETLWVCVC